MTSPATPPAAHQSDFSRGLDCLRGFAALGVVVGHASMAYLRSFPPSTLWPVVEPTDAAFPEMLYLYGRSAGVPVFFAISGFHAARALMGHDPLDFGRRRLRRLGWPFVLGVLFVLPLLYPIWGLGAWRRDYVQFAQIIDFRLATTDKQALFGPAHLWFLEHLLILSLALVALVRLVPSLNAMPQKTAPGGSWRLLLGALFVGAILASLAIHFEPFTIHDFANTFLPPPLVLMHGGVFFGIGFLIGRNTPLRDRLVGGGVGLWLVGHALFVAWMHFTAAGSLAPTASSRSLTESVGAGVSGVVCAAGWLGIAARSPALPGIVVAPLRGLGRASLDVYVFHLPGVWLAQVAMYQSPLPLAPRIVIATLAGLALGLVAHKARAYFRRRASRARRSMSARSFSAPRSVGR